VTERCYLPYSPYVARKGMVVVATVVDDAHQLLRAKCRRLQVVMAFAK